jgi:hypothetical protein
MVGLSILEYDLDEKLIFAVEPRIKEFHNELGKINGLMSS